MVIYDSGDSDLLIQSLSENLGSATAVLDSINQGTQHLNSVIDSGALSGAAYRAGQSLFQTYISPMIQKLASAITDIKGDLASYKTAEQEVRYLSSHLDEEKLNEKLANTNRLIQLVEQKIAADRQVIQKFMSSGFEGVANGLAELPGLDRQLDNLKQLKHDYEKKLLALQTFSSSTNSLFTDSLQAFKYVLKGVDLINQSTSSSDGTISFPAGADMSWFTKLQAEKFSSILSTESELIKKYKKEPAAIEAIKNLSSSMSISIKEAEKLYLQFQKIGKNKNELDKIKKKVKLTNAYLGNAPKGKGSDKLKDFTAKKITGNYGSIEILKLQNTNSIVNGKHSIVSNTKFSKGTSTSGENIHVGTNWGGSSSLVSLNLNEFRMPVLPATINTKADFSKSDFSFYKGANGSGEINVGGSATLTAVEGSGAINLKIPFIGKKVTIGGSVSISAGASGHLSSSKKDGFSVGFKLGLGPGAGVNFKVK
ncbi:hypothetical protein RU86_GL001645 [Lactococcus piscium]|uniref:LXG domain-containing protein n=1 Tax=Pseudolactococcus piscium TaxID=1364 RepID=A0A2A5RUI3_9LACT|nr:hypothetical protein [Lactococcus piscium]PCS04311.1 hypothetical protein RU86_GL001645 [Lactococcus piscium]